MPDGVLIIIGGSCSGNTSLGGVGVIDNLCMRFIPYTVNADHIHRDFLAADLPDFLHAVFAVHRNIPVETSVCSFSTLLPYPTIRVDRHGRILQKGAVIKVMTLKGFRSRNVLVVFHDVIGDLFPLGDKDHAAVLAVTGGSHGSPVFLFENKAIRIQPTCKLISFSRQQGMLSIIRHAVPVLGDGLAVGDVFIADGFVCTILITVIGKIELDAHVKPVVIENIRSADITQAVNASVCIVICPESRTE